MANYDAGTLFARIVPSFQGVQKQIARESRKWAKEIATEVSQGVKEGVEDGLDQSRAPAAKDGEKAAGYFADAFKARLKKALADLPEAEIDADSSKADRKLAELRARMQELSGKTIGVDIDAGKAEAELKTIQLQLTRLARKSPNVQVRVDVAKASAELAAFRAELDGLNGKRGFGAFAAAVPSISGVTAAIVALSTTAVPALAVVAGGAIALGGALAGALAGVAGLAAVAVPAFQHIADANQKIAAAQKTVASASLAQKKAEQGVTDAKTVGQKAAALARLRQANAQLASARGNLAKANNLLTPSEKGLSGALDATKRAFTGWAKALEPAVLPLFTAGLRLVKPLLDALTPVVVNAAAGLGSFLGSVQAFVQSPWFSQFADTLGGLAQEAIPTFGRTVLSLVQAFGNMVTAFAPVTAVILPGLASLADRFANWTASNSFQSFVAYVVQNLPAVGRFIGNVVTAIGNIVQAVAPIGSFVLPIVTNLIGLIAKIPVGVLRALAIAIGVVTAAIIVFNVAMAVFDIVTSPVTLIIGAIILAIGLLTVGIYELVTHWKQIWGAISTYFGIVWRNIKAVATAIWGAISGYFVGKWHELQAVWHLFWSNISSFFKGVWAGIKFVATSVWNAIAGFFKGALAGIKFKWESTWHAIGSAFSSAWNGVKKAASSVWDWIEKRFTDGVNAVLKAVNWLIRTVDSVLRFLHLPQIPQIPLLGSGKAARGVDGGSGAGNQIAHRARGGTISGPGTGTSDSILGLSAGGVPTAMVSNGEYVVNAKSTGMFLPLLHALNSAGLPGHARGGEVGGLPGFSLGGLLGSVWGGITNVASWIGGSVSGIWSHISGAISGLFSGAGGWAKGLGTGVVKDLIGGAIKKLSGVGASSFHAGAGVAQWAPTILKALALAGQPASWLGTVERRMNQESGGNPNAINLWDSNARAGHPSQGLMQTIPSTFNAFAGPLRSLGILNPLANIFAAIRYSISRYGSIAGMNRPGGYALGGPVGMVQPQPFAMRGGSSMLAGLDLQPAGRDVSVNAPIDARGLSADQMASALVRKMNFAMR